MRKRIVATSVVVTLAVPGVVGAQERILESAERLAAETVLQPAPEFRRSGGRVVMGIAMAAAGVAMMLIEPSQPTQPQTVADDMLTVEVSEFLVSDAFGSQLVHLAAANGNFLFCAFESTCTAYVFGAADGGIIGAAAALATTTDGTRTLYDGPIQPFEKPNAGLRYGGAALAVAGAAVAALWSSVPVMRDVSVAPTRGGVAVGGRIGF